MFFLRKVKLDTEPISIKMSGIRMGERLLQIGIDDPKLAAAMALKIGLSGTTAVAVRDDADAERARDAAARAGALIDLHVTPAETMPFANDAFDVVVVHAMRGVTRTFADQGRTAAAFAEARRVLRRGGRVIVIEPGPKSGLAGILKPYRPDPQHEAAGGTTRVLEAAAFRPVRVLTERDGYRFVEGLKT
jgi:ubiquinone/menaquinone biosynthesis C-methylase UbiE